MLNEVGDVVFELDNGPDIVVMKAAFSQVRGDSGTINITCRQPEDGRIPSGEFGDLSIEINGTLTKIARGQVVGVPLRLAGEVVDFELICRGANNAKRIDSLYQAIDSQVPLHVDTSLDPRRTAPYLLSDVYVDPISFDVSLDPIAGSADPVITLYGEGADPDASKILGLEMNLRESPVDTIELTETTDFRHQVWSKVDLGDALFAKTQPDERATYTPVALSDAISKITLDGGYELLSTHVEYNSGIALRVYTEKKTVDPFTCIITPAEYTEYPIHEVSELNITTVVEAVQDRVEIVKVDIDTMIQQIGGVSQLTEVTSLHDADSLARTSNSFSYQTFRNNLGIGGGTLTTTRWITRYGTNFSIWKNAGGLNPKCLPSLEAMVRRAARIAVERAHCVELTVVTHDVAAMTLTLKDRVRIYDTRLPAGVAVGKVTGIEVSMIDQAAITTLSLSCPVSDPDNLSSKTIGSGTDGLVEIDIGRQITSMSSVDHTFQMESVMGGYANDLVQNIEFTDNQPEQYQKMWGTNEQYYQIKNPGKEMPKTGFSMELTDISPADIEDINPTSIHLSRTLVKLPEGITI